MSRAGAASPNPDKHFQWDWRVSSSLGTVGHAPEAYAWPDTAHSTKRVAASTVTGGFCLFSQVSLPGSEILDPGSFPIFAPWPTIVLMSDDLPRSHETENTVYRYLIAISKLRLGILTEQGEGS